MAEYKVLITTSGVGSRLGAFTEHTNKALVRVGEKAAISHILDTYDATVPIVVTLGAFGKHVRDYLELAHPKREFEFVEVDKYEGPGSSLGYSMWQAREHLQCPFVYHCSDAILGAHVSVPDPFSNWLGGCVCENSAQYRTLEAGGGYVLGIEEKGDSWGRVAYIGIAGVSSYDKFWDALGELIESGEFGESLSDVHVYPLMGVKLRYVELPTWYDVGNVDSLRRTREAFPADYAMEKHAEGTYVVGQSVIKFFADARAAHDRVRRANEVLPDVVPKITGERAHFYRYEFARGRTLSKTITPERMADLLEWAAAELWCQASSYYNTEEYRKRVRAFYGAKTIDRLGLLAKTMDVSGALKLLGRIDWDAFLGEPVARIHGDFILDNILDQRDGFKLIDWRQDFAGGRDVFDVYYDFAKLNHSLVFSHELIERGLYDAKTGEVLRSDNLCDCQDVLREWIEARGWSWKRVETLTAIVWLNMAPLHKPPLNELLYRLGERKLCRALKT